MAKFHLKNENGFFAEIGKEFIITKYALEHLKKEAENPSPKTSEKFSSKDLEKILSALEVIKTLPEDHAHLILLKNDKKGLVYKAPEPHMSQYNKGYSHDYPQSYIVPFVKKFSPTSRMFSHGYEIERRQFLETTKKMSEISNYKILSDFAKFHEVNFGQKMFKKTKELQDKLDSGAYTASEFNSTNDFGKSEMCLVYVASKTGGAYISPNHMYVPIGSARIFESPAHAEKFISEKGYTGKAVVVHAEIMVKKIGETAKPVTGDLSHLKEAIITMEREALMKALEGATVEQLKERLSKYEDVSILDQKNQPKKRAM